MDALKNITGSRNYVENILIGEDWYHYIDEEHEAYEGIYCSLIPN